MQGKVNSVKQNMPPAAFAVLNAEQSEIESARLSEAISQAAADLALYVPICAEGGTGLWMLHLFQGYSLVTCMVVLNLAVSGLLVSWIMKFADSIMKVRPAAARMCAVLQYR